MPLRRLPATLFESAKFVLTNDIMFRVRVMLHSGLFIKRTLNYLEECISSLPPPLATKIAQSALKCSDLFCERSSLGTDFLNVLVRTLLNDGTTEFKISELHSYQVRQAVLNRICELRHLQTYYSLSHFHENVNIFATLKRMQSLPNLKQVYLANWCSDEIARLLAESCPNLQLLDAQNSSLTDRSIHSLSRCKRLQVLLINSTAISDYGYEKLLQNLPLLQKIGFCKSLKYIIARVQKNRESLLLKEYESCEFPDENVAFMCPYLTRVCFLGCQAPSEQSKLPHRVTHLKIQSVTVLNLKTILTPNLIHLDLGTFMLTEEYMTAIADVCSKLRVLRLHPMGLNSQLRLVTHKQAPFQYLEELNVPDSALALDILMVSKRIRQITIEPRRDSSPFSPQIPIWTDAVLAQILDKNPLHYLQSFCLATSCNFSAKIVFHFLMNCPEIRSLGNIGTWGHNWDKKVSKVYPILRKYNLGLELVH